MMAATRTVWSALSALLFMLLGAIGVHLVTLGYHAGIAAWDQSRPVWVPEKVTVLDREGEYLRVHVVGTKLRACVLLRSFAVAHYGSDAAASTDVSMWREDGSPVGHISRPLGRQDIGVFVLHRVPPEARDVVINLEYSCDGRVVPGVLAKIDLADAK